MRRRRSRMRFRSPGQGVGEGWFLDAARDVAGGQRDSVGVGTIESDPDGISCPSRCSAAFPKGKTVLLTAKPSSSRFVLKHWYGNCTGNQLCSLTPGNATVYISAVFGPAMDELRVSKSGDGTGKVTSVPSGIDCGAICAHSFERGTAVVLEAQPEAASRFAGWSGDCSGRGVCRVTLQRDTSVTARFEHIRDEVRVVKTGPGVGLVTSRPAGVSCGDTCVAAFARGTRVELTSIPDRSSRFGGWGGGCTGKNVCTLTLAGPAAVRARFERIQDELRVQKGGRAGATSRARRRESRAAPAAWRRSRVAQPWRCARCRMLARALSVGEAAAQAPSAVPSG